jgi:hypothetical protein
MNKQTQSQQIVADLVHQSQHEQAPSGFAQFIGAALVASAIYALIALTFSL